jgi:hypothetical protein
MESDSIRQLREAVKLSPDNTPLRQALADALLGAGLAGFLSPGGSPDLYLWPACSGGVVLAAIVLRRRLKLSQHVAFDLFAALAVLPSVGAAVAIAVLTGAVAWSRLKLGRHTRAEIGVGMVVGLVVGALFQMGLRFIRG